MKSIHAAMYVEKVDLSLPGSSEYDFFIDNFSSMEMWADRSDLAELNNELETSKLKIIKEIPKDASHYTHIVQMTGGVYFAVLIKDGDWIDQLHSS